MYVIFPLRSVAEVDEVVLTYYYFFMVMCYVTAPDPSNQYLFSNFIFIYEKIIKCNA